MKTKLGDHVKDEITGLEGVVLARLEGLYEATQCCVHQRELKPDGEVHTGVWFEEARLSVQGDRGKRLVGFPVIAGESLK